MANQRIVLAELNLDTQGLLREAEKVRRELLEMREANKALRESGEELSPQFIRNQAEISRLSRNYNTLQAAVRSQINVDGQLVSQEQAVTRALERQIVTEEDAILNSRELIAIRRRLNTTTDEGRAALANINARIDENTEFIRQNGSAHERQRMNIGRYTESILDAYNTIQKQKSELEELNKQLVVQRNSLNENSQEWAILNQQINNNATQINVYTAELAEMRGEQEGFGESLELTQGGLTGFIQKANEAGGAGPLLRNTFSQITTGIWGMVKAGVAFIATPLGAAIATLVAGFVGVKKLWDFNAGLQEMNKQLTSLGVSKEELSGVRSEIKATADTYEQEFEKIAQSSNAVSKAFKLSMSEANDVVAQSLAGLTKEQQDQILEMSNEYSVFFANAGYSAQDFFNVLNSGFEAGVFNDKLPDALKEADLSLKEQTQSTRDALVNAFGASFTNDILSRVKNGETTTKNALEEIAKKSTEVGLTQQQNAQLTADVFRGAGEDVGGALKIFEIVGKSSNKEMTAAAKAAEELREANERLNKVQAELFEINGLGDAWVKVKAVVIDALSAFLEYFAEIKENIQPVIELIGTNFVMSWNALKAAVQGAFQVISSGFKVIANTIGTLIKTIGKLLQGDFKGALQAVQDGVMNFLNIFRNAFNSIKNTIIGFVQDIVDSIGPLLSKFGVDIDAVKDKLESWKSKKVEVKATVTQEGPTQAEVEKKASADLKEQLQKQVDMYAQRKARLEAMGKDSFFVEQKMLQLQLGLYEKGSKEYEDVVTNLMKLRADHANKSLTAEASRLKTELDLFLSTQDAKNLAVEEEIRLADQIRIKKLAIAEAEYKASKKTADDLNKLRADQNKINMEYIDKQTNAVVANAEKEYQNVLAANKSKLDANKFLNDEAVRQEKERLDTIATAEKDAAVTKLEAAKATQYEIDAALAEIDEENRKQQEALDLQKAEADKAKKLLDIENQNIADEGNFFAKVDRERERLAILRQQELDEAEKTGADKAAINAKYDKLEKDLDQSIADFKMGLAKDTFDNFATILGKQSALGKAAAIAQTTIDTYQAAMAAYKSLAEIPIVGPALGAIAAAAAVATGLSNVKKIASTKTPKAEKGALFSIGGRRHSAGGTTFTGEDGTQFEAEKGELIGVMSRNASRHFMAFNNAFTPGTPSPSSYLASGGIVSRTERQASLDVDDLAMKIAAANAALPAQTVIVQDIANVSDTIVRVNNIAEHG